MSWSYRIVIVFILFFAGLGTMVYIAAKQSNEMVEDNYYDRELKYQAIIDAKNNFSPFKDSIRAFFAGNELQLRLPPGAVQNVEKGEVVFLNPSDKSKDRTIPLKMNSLGEQNLPKTAVVPGFYLVKASWTNNGVAYFDERKISLK